jgi:hypothetical protein
MTQSRTQFLRVALFAVWLLTCVMRGQPVDPDVVRILPVWPGSAEAARHVQGAFVFRDPTDGIVVSYPDPSNPEANVTFRFHLRNRVDPRISVMLSRMPDGKFSYRYTLSNGPLAKTAVTAWRLVATPSPMTTVGHPVWQGFNFFQMVNSPQILLKHAGKGASLAWTDGRSAEPIGPGQNLDMFEVVSPLRPGLVTAYVSGLEKPITVPANLPDAIEKTIMVLEKPGVIDRAIVTLGPRFALDVGRNAVVTAYQQDIDDLVTEGLVDHDSALATKLEQVIIAAPGSAAPAPQISTVKPIEREILDGIKMSLSPQK